MSMLINEECINCGACEPDCPNDAISEGDDVYDVDPALCTECIGHADEPVCIELCPVDDCIAVDPARVETKEQLTAKFERLHA